MNLKILPSLSIALLNAVAWLCPAPLAASPAPAPLAKKTTKNKLKAVPHSNLVAAGRIVVQIQSGSDNHEGSPDYSTYIDRQDNRKYSQKRIFK